MKAVLKLKTPIKGYWDGGSKDMFVVKLDRNPDGSLRVHKDSKGKYIRIHCYDANYWFEMSMARSERETLYYAIKYLHRRFKKTDDAEIESITYYMTN